MHRAWNGIRGGEFYNSALRTSFMMRYLMALLVRRDFREVDLLAKIEAFHAFYPDVAIVGDEYPGYVFELEEHSKHPNLKCLVIYRDGRDVVSSTLAKAKKWRGSHVFRNVDSVEKIIDRWLLGIKNMQENADNIYVVRYEELVANSQKAMADIGAWLGVDGQKFHLKSISDQSIGKY